jgi:hypothetical protein
VERALRLYVGRRALETAQSMSALTEDEAMRIAYDELFGPADQPGTSISGLPVCL